MQFGISTDKGLTRSINQDYYGLIKAEGNIPNTFIIADGMGGHNAGEVASKLSVELALSYIKEHFSTNMNKEEMKSKLEEMMKYVNTKVYNASWEKKENAGMGTTLTVVMLLNDSMLIAHVGDSRVYLLRNNELEQITNDHSYVGELLRNGSITKEEARNSSKKNVLTRAIGCYKDVDIDVYSNDVKNNDRILMCTDGLTNMVDDDHIKDVLLSKDKPQEITEYLIAKANENGGTDNTTIIVFDGVNINGR